MRKESLFSLGLLGCGIAIGCGLHGLQWLPIVSAQPPFRSGVFNSPANNPPVNNASENSSRVNNQQPALQGSLPGTPAYGTGGYYDNTSTGSSFNAIPDAELLPEERVNIAVYDRCNRGVVHIDTRSIRMDSFLQVSLREGTGSGSIIDKSGIILTNQHVIEGAKEITVRLFNGVPYSATIVGQDADTDIAVLKIEAPAEQLEPIPFGDSRALRVGQRIYAIGNPFGLERTMSAGMISCANRQLPSRERRIMRSFLQVDAALNQGNSGGPLLNTRGELVGMNSAIMSSSGDSAGVGFAIPSSTIQRILSQLSKHGKVAHATIGISRVYENERGLLIVSMTRGGPAETAGLKGFRLVSKLMIDPSSADLIQTIDGVEVRTADTLIAAIDDRKPGDTVVLGILRGGQTMQVPVKLGSSE
jgi:S1-C subfamily serine protease